MIELERTYLAKYLPEDLKECESKEIIDIYIPKDIKPPKHAPIRLRKKGEHYEITKKEVVDEGDFSKLKEQTILLTEPEFNELSRLEGKKVHKIRYYYPYKNRVAEIDVFQGPLKGLVVVEVEFDDEEEKNSFDMPEFCLVDVTPEDFVAGGMICGKSYEDIEEELKRHGYSKLFVE